MRSFNGCWTCRLRRKKCDENHPVCGVCSGLNIVCHYGPDKPVWMDGGVRQKEIATRLKREIKEKAHRGWAERAVQFSVDHNSVTEAPTGVHPTTASDRHNATGRSLEAPNPWLQHEADGNDDHDSMAFGQSDTVLFMFYLENLVPFLFPFYRPSVLQGSRAWLLDMLISRSVVRQAALCQSFYFLALMQGTADDDRVWEKMLLHTQDAFEVLRQALQLINGSGLATHAHCAVRILTSIIQLQRFEITVLSFSNWQAHLSAALTIFKQLLEHPGAIDGSISSFDATINRLCSSSRILSIQHFQVPSPEQAAFRFSSALVILDDIVASTALQEQPRLYKYHRDLLGGTQAPINLEAVVGLQNWVLLYIGEIAALDAWKQRCRTAGSLDVTELAYRATAIKEALVPRLLRLETNLATIPEENDSLLDVFVPYNNHLPEEPTIRSSLVTRVWAHAAFIYLFVVTSGWKPTSVEVRYHVGQTIQLLEQISPPALLRTMVWPFCVAGCLVEPSQEVHLRRMAEALRPRSVFGTVYKALEIMENVWRNREGDLAARDFAACFRDQADLVLLV
ncbi:fungal-specific transcription factor domain-containing protein [Xylariales sp. AK1849]|nr:fungal-specific transcription factor domain-containing protein [Xylariales sp. AK1849]